MRLIPQLRLLFVLCALGLVTLFNSCGDKLAKDEDVIAFRNQDVVFHYDVWNLLSGRHIGWFIDGEGSILGYSQPESWEVADANGYYSAEAMMTNFSQADSLIGTVKDKVMNQQVSLIKDAAQGMLVEGQKGWNSDGTIRYVAYMYEPDKQRYKEVPLKETQSVQFINNTGAAQELLDWMQELD